MDKILDDFSQVRGIVYCVEHIATGKKYVGQTRTHRENHGRYRPFGAEGRFRVHISEAQCNTKHKSGHLLGTDIRAHGQEAFKLSTLEVCDLEHLDSRESFWISELKSIYPDGYNISPGKFKASYHEGKRPYIPNPDPLSMPGKHGGCKFRSEETRTKMSERAKENCSTEEFRKARTDSATSQHAAVKAKKFAETTVDHSNIGQYIFTKGNVAIARVNGVEASFAGKGKTKEENIERAKEFLLTLPQTATLPNCSGNP
jgi:hypothetical protein